MKEAALHFAYFVSYAIHVPGHDFYTFGSMEVHFPVEDLTRLVHIRQIENMIKSELLSNSGYPNDTVVALINWKRLADDDAQAEAQDEEESESVGGETAEIRQFKRKSR